MSEQEIFLAAVEIADLDTRQKYLDETCAGNAEMRRKVDALLKAYLSAGNFLNTPALQQIAASGDGDGDRTQGYTGGPGADEADLSLEFLSPSEKPGTLGRLGHYEVHEVLGHGAFGIVLKAFDEKLHRMVAIKVMSPELAATSPPRKRFLREARSAAAIRHENVVAVHAVEEQPLPYLVMEYIPGQTLHQALDEHGPLDVPDVLRIGQQIACGLAAAHGQGLIHRDIKPSNILLENGLSGRVKISDFGLARAADDASATQSGTIAGTPMFMSPEQATTGHIDQRSDLFSLGSVLYVMTSGRPPFRAANTLAVLKRVVDDTPRPIHEIIADTPDWLCAIIAKLQAKKPEDRFATAQDVADLLGKCLADLQANRTVQLPAGIRIEEKVEATAAPVELLSASVATHPRTPARPHSHAASRRPWPIIAALILLAAGAFGITDLTGVTNWLVHRQSVNTGTLVVEVDGNETYVTITPQKGEWQRMGHVWTVSGKEELKFDAGRYLLTEYKFAEKMSERVVEIQPGQRIVAQFTMENDQREVPLVIPGLDFAAERQVAEFVLSKNGQVTISDEVRTTWRNPGMPLPRANFFVAKIDLEGRLFADAELPRLQPAKRLELLKLRQTRDVTAAGVQQLAATLPKCRIEWDGGVIEPRETSNGWPADAPPLAIAPFDAEQAKKHQETWAAYLDVPVEYTNSIGMTFRLIPPGEFQMGATETEVATLKRELQQAGANDYDKFVAQSSGPRHTVRITQPFYLAQHEVTVGQYRTFIESSRYVPTMDQLKKKLFKWQDSAVEPNADVRAVIGVSWEDALAFCRWASEQQKLSYDLPTEAQWELACRAGTTTPWFFGDDVSQLVDYAVYGRDALWPAEPVGSKLPNPFGLYDVHGNADEWCQDWHTGTFYAISPVDDPVNQELPQDKNSGRAARSGTAGSAPWWTRATTRAFDFAATPNTPKGFRPVLTVESVRQSLWSKPGPNRLAAEWVLSIGGEVTVQIGPAHRRVESLDKLPKQKFFLLVADLRGNKNVNDDGLLNLRRLIQLNNPNLNSTAITDRGLAILAEIPSIEHLAIGETQITDDGLAVLKKLPRLKNLRLTGTAISDAGLEHLTGLTTLHAIQVDKTRVTEAGIDKLAAALPKCRIEWDGGVIEPRESSDPDHHDADVAAIEWAFSLGAPLSRYSSFGPLSLLAHPSELPSDGLWAITLTGVAGWTDADLSRLSGCKRLGAIILADTDVTDAGLALLRPLRELGFLNLSGCPGVTDEGLEYLSGLRRLEVLEIANTQATPDKSIELAADHMLLMRRLLCGPGTVTMEKLARLSELPRLTELGMFGESGLTSTHLAELARLQGLTHLRVNGRGVTDEGLEQLSKLGHLQYLGLDGTEITDAGLRHLTRLNELQYVELHNTSISDAGLGELSKLKSLTVLVLQSTKVTDAGLDAVRVMTNLGTLNLQSTAVTDAGLARLSGHPQLTRLRLGSTRITDAGLDALKSIPKLNEVYLLVTDVTEAGVTKLAAALPKCRIDWDGGVIEPRETSDADRLAAEWVLRQGKGRLQVTIRHDGKHKKLSGGEMLPEGPFALFELTASNTESITSEDLDPLIDLTYLSAVDLNGTRVDAAGLSRLARVPLLESLGLADTLVRSSDLSALGKLPRLSKLWLSADQVDDNWAFLTDLKSLRVLRIPGVPGSVRELGAYPQLRVIDLRGISELEASVVDELQSRNPKLTILVGDGAKKRAVGLNPAVTAGRVLAAKHVQVSGLSWATHAPVEISETTNELENLAWIGDLVIPPTVTLSADERESIDLFAGSLTTFRAPELKEADKYASVLAKSGALGNVDLTNSDLTDAGLAELSRVTGLRHCALRGTKVTAAGVKQFKHRQPACEVDSDFGTLEREFILPPKASTSAWQGWPADAPQPAIAPFDAEQAKKHQEEWAKHLGVPVEYTNSIGMKFRLIPPGEFLMGSTDEEKAAAIAVSSDEFWHEWIQSEAPSHTATISQPFYLGIHEVSQALFRDISGINPSHFSAGGKGKVVVAGQETAMFPVESVSWNDAAVFCSRMSEREQHLPNYAQYGDVVSTIAGTGYRLPTEIEWEFACRAGTNTKYWPGDKIGKLESAAWFGPTSDSRPHAAGEQQANAFGLFDVHGNVWEWTQDSWEPNTAELNRSDSAAVDRVLKGGDWHNLAAHCRAASRARRNHLAKSYDSGFRVALSVDAVKQALAASQPADAVP